MRTPGLPSGLLSILRRPVIHHCNPCNPSKTRGMRGMQGAKTGNLRTTRAGLDVVSVVRICGIPSRSSAAFATSAIGKPRGEHHDRVSSEHPCWTAQPRPADLSTWEKKQRLAFWLLSSWTAQPSQLFFTRQIFEDDLGRIAAIRPKLEAL